MTMGRKKDKFGNIVADNLDYYKKIGEISKTLSENTIFVEERKNHRGFDYGTVKLDAEISDALLLEVERNQISIRDFKFKIYDKSLMPRPCYRFDSDGEAHLNPGDIPLSERKITAPHFHRFNDNGVEIAYKTSEWVENTEALLSNQSLALASFAGEEKIAYEKLPEICKSEELIPPENIMFDPLAGENFYE